MGFCPLALKLYLIGSLCKVCDVKHFQTLTCAAGAAGASICSWCGYFPGTNVFGCTTEGPTSRYEMTTAHTAARTMTTVKRPPSRPGAEQARGPPPLARHSSGHCSSRTAGGDAKLDHAPLPAALGRLDELRRRGLVGVNHFWAAMHHFWAGVNHDGRALVTQPTPHRARALGLLSRNRRRSARWAPHSPRSPRQFLRPL
jgi:hypothetical protein